MFTKKNSANFCIAYILCKVSRDKLQSMKILQLFHNLNLLTWTSCDVKNPKRKINHKI